MKTVSQRLQTLQQLGLGYLTLGEETPSLSGGEAQRLKLASEIGRTQTDSVFVFDEPSIGLHPLDVQVLLRVFQALLDNGATVVVIEHDSTSSATRTMSSTWGRAEARAAAASWQQARRRRSGKIRRVLPEDIYNKKGQVLHGICPFVNILIYFPGHRAVRHGSAREHLLSGYF